MSRVMKRLNLTRKTLYPSAKASERVQALRAEYWQAVRDVRVEDLVFIDESGVNLGLVRLFAWALQGSRAHGKKPKRGRNVSLVAGLSLKGVVGSAALLLHLIIVNKAILYKIDSDQAVSVPTPDKLNIQSKESGEVQTSSDSLLDCEGLALPKPPPHNCIQLNPHSLANG